MDKPGTPLHGSRLELSTRIGTSWTDLRRGATMSALRDYLYGPRADALDQGQMDALELLTAEPTWRMSSLAEALRVDPSTATRAVQRLVDDGLAERRPCPEDKRVVEVAITAKGRARHREAAQRVHQLMKHILDSFEPAEAWQLADLMERLVGAVDEFVGRTERPAP